jgi:hypothetical protein
MKTSSKKRKRRDPYLPALWTAKRRHEKAVKEREFHMARLTELAVEIPRLEQIISVLETPSEGWPRGTSGLTEPAVQIPESGLQLIVPDHLRRLIGPRSGPVEVPTQPEGDDLLPEAEGKEVLP